MTRTYRVSWLVLALFITVAPPAAADVFFAYSQGGIPPGDLFTWCDTPPCDVSQPVLCDTPEGSASLRINTNVWGGFGMFPSQSYDLTAYADGEVRFFVKAPADGAGNPYGNVKIEIQCTGGAPQSQNLIDHGWDPTNSTQWQEISIPVCDFFGGTCDLACLGAVTSPFLATLENLPFFNTMWIDYVHWKTPNSHTGASSVQVQGRQFQVDGEPFVVNGMGYAPVGICENWQAGWADRADRYSVDFPLIAASGANTVRLYAPITSTAMLDAAWAAGLYVMPNFFPDPTQLTCAAGKQFMQDRLEEMVLDWGDHPAILAWLVGNEFNVNLGGNDLCLDWYPQLDALAQTAHAAEGASSHPVGTANADTVGLVDICQAGCSDDTSLPNLDFWAVQLYRGCTFGNAFTEYVKPDCARPLIVTEFGADAWDSFGPGSEDQAMQADCLEMQLDEANQGLAVRTPGGVSSGQVLFEWADEWWKAECVPTTDWCVQDTCASSTNPAYPDPEVNEEWFGVATLDSGDPNARGLRTAYTTLSQSWWQLGPVLNLQVDSHDAASGNTTVSFNPAVGASDHTLYYGPLSAVSSYGYSASIPGLGVSGSSSVTLPAGSLFWIVVGRTNGAEGCYGKDYACTERPASPGASIPQSANRTCSVPQCP